MKINNNIEDLIPQRHPFILLFIFIASILYDFSKFAILLFLYFANI